MNIVNYIITVLSNGSQLFTEHFDGHSVEGNIGYNFKPDTTYEFRLKAHSEAGSGKEEAVSVITDKHIFCEYLILNFGINACWLEKCSKWFVLASGLCRGRCVVLLSKTLYSRSRSASLGTGELFIGAT